MLNLKALKKIFLLLVFTVAISCVSAAAYAKEQLPKINFVGMEHSPLVSGDSQSIYVTSDYEGMVEYRVWLSKVNTNSWEDITDGYTEAVDAKTPYVISPDTKFTEGKYKLSVWVKRAEVEGTNKVSQGSYDTYYVANLNCVNKDDNNRVYVNNAMDIEKEEYALGEKVIINGIKDVAGIKGPYKYKLHYFSPSKANDKNTGWMKNVTDYDDKIEWTPTEIGTYVLDVHVNTETSTTWNTYLNKKKENKLDDVYGTYEAWKLMVITVKEKVQEEKEINLNETNKVYGSLDEKNPQIMNKDINFSMQSVTLRNIVQTGNINMLEDSGVLENAQVNGNINVTGNNAKLSNVKVKGTIVINPGNSGIVHLNNVQADEIQILSGATESIHLNDVTAPMVIINSDNNVRVETTGKTVIDKVAIKSNVILENANSSIKEVEIMAKENSEINLKGNYELINVMKTVNLNIVEGKISKISTTVPFNLKLDEKAYVTELDKNKLEVKVSGKDTNISTVKNNNSVVPPVVVPPTGGTGGTGGTVAPPTGGTVVPPIVHEGILNSISIVLDDGSEVTGSGSESEINADISSFKDTDKLLYINIQVYKDCTLEIKGVSKKFTLIANEINKIYPNDLNALMDKENDGVSLLNVRAYLVDSSGYMVTNQKLTSGSETMQVVLRVKAK